MVKDGNSLKKKALWVRQETLAIHRIAQGIRLASSLSPVEIFVALFYGKVLKINPKKPRWEGRDRLIISKGHGSISLYPILADFGYFDKKELCRVGMEGTFLGVIPDTVIPGYETTNGSLGHGLGVGCGVALALKRQGRREKIFILHGDGELHEGSVWEAIMFAGEHHLGNLILIIDNNKRCMLDYCRNIFDLEPLRAKFRCFNWEVETVDGHDIPALVSRLNRLKKSELPMPKVLIANTVKGRGVPQLEKDPLCHIKVIKPGDIDRAIEGLNI
jgi:transketolase